MSLRIWLPLTKDLRNQGLDDVTVTNNGATFDANGKLGGCYSFDGSTSSINTNINIPNFALDKTYSITCWVCPSGTSGQKPIIGIGPDWSWTIFQQNTDLRFVQWDESGSRWGDPAISGVFSANTWVHIGVVWNQGVLLFYKNGEKIYEWTAPTSRTIKVSSDTVKIGGNIYAWGNNYFNGKLNDFRIYDHALSPMEVKQISQGLILHYPLNNNGWGQENLLKDSKNQRNSKNTYIYWPFTSEDISKISGNVCTISFDAKSTVNNVACDIYFRNTGIVGQSIRISNITTKYKRYSVTMTAPTSTFVSICIRNNGNVSGASTTATYSYKNIKVELGQKATPWCPHEADELYDKLGLNDNVEYDTSGFCNNGTRTGTFSWISDTPKYNVSTKFSANTIKNTIFNFTSNIWTVAFWYYYDTAPSAYQGFLCLSRNAGGDADKKLAAMPKSSYIWFKFENTNLTVSSLKIKVWTHIVMTFDGTNGKVYENGVLKGTTGAASSIYTNCDDFVIGARANAADATTTTCQLIGNMSDVRIYATALSTDDIKALYQNSAYIDNQGNIYGAIYEEV